MDPNVENQPQQPVDDLSAFDTDAPALGYNVGSDQDAIRAIKKRTSLGTKILIVLAIVGLGVVSVIVWKIFATGAAEEARLLEIGQMERGPEQLAALREAFSTIDNDGLQVRILRNLIQFEDREAGPVFVKALEERGEVRRFGAIGLAKLKQNLHAEAPEGAVAKLLQILPEAQQFERSGVTWALAVYGEQTAAEEILKDFAEGRYQEDTEISPMFDASIIAAVLGPARLASDELMMHDEQSIRQLTAQALAEAASPEVVQPLTRLLQAELARPVTAAEGQPSGSAQSIEVIRSAAAGLGRTGSPEAAQPLFQVLSEQPTLRPGVLDSLKHTTGAPAIATLIGQAQDIGLKRDLARVLAETHDPRAADALAALVATDDSDLKFTAAIALAALGDARSVPALLQFAAGEDESNSDASIQALRELHSPDAAAGLLELLPPSCPDELDSESDPKCFRQAAVLRALGASGNQDAGRRIMDALTGVDSPAAAMALAELNYEPGFRAVLELAERPADIDMAATEAGQRSLTNEDLLRNRRGAVQALGRYGRPEAIDPLKTIVDDDHDDYEIRAFAAASLGMVADAETLAAVIAKAQDEATPEHVRYYYVQALWQKPQPALNEPLLGLIRSNAPDALRLAAGVALGYAGDPANDAALLELIANENTRTPAGFAVVLGGTPAQAEALAAALEDDRNAREDIQNGVNSDSNDWFNQITNQMFESGAIWRRAAVSHRLSELNHGYAWQKFVAALKSGWSGLDGVPSHVIRQRLYAALTGEDAGRRVLAAKLLGTMQEFGLLLRARDEGGVGADEARDQLNAMQRAPTG
jgi:HEAT repeat protein